jgi:transposase
VNRIKGLCALHGIYDYEPLRSDRMRRLEQLRTGDGRELPPRVGAEIRRELQRLELVLQMIKAIEKERNAIASGKAAPSHPYANKIQSLVKIKSIGSEIATVLAGEVFYRRFDNRQQLGSYVGLTPSPFKSGAVNREQGISKAGNPKGLSPSSPRAASGATLRASGLDRSSRLQAKGRPCHQCRLALA